jgi:hypothetical protein
MGRGFRWGAERGLGAVATWTIVSCPQLESMFGGDINFFFIIK